jgi:hypothetical protein
MSSHPGISAARSAARQSVRFSASL